MEKQDLALVFKSNLTGAITMCTSPVEDDYEPTEEDKAYADETCGADGYEFFIMDI